MKNSNRNWQDRQWNEDSNNQNRRGNQSPDRNNDYSDRYNAYDNYSTGASSWDRDEQDYRGHARSMNDDIYGQRNRNDDYNQQESIQQSEPI